MQSSISKYMIMIFLFKKKKLFIKFRDKNRIFPKKLSHATHKFATSDFKYLSENSIIFKENCKLDNPTQYCDLSSMATQFVVLSMVGLVFTAMMTWIGYLIWRYLKLRSKEVMSG